MLRHLHIENYVLIDKLDLDFAEGFSAVTGQTGAGKSILLGALGLVLGNRADLKSISEDKNRCIIEAEFDISDYGLEHFFEENDLEYSDYCILRRELYRSGKSRNFLNDSPAAASILRALGERLIDIHSQHNNLLLKDSGFQTSILDSAAQNAGLLDEYRIRLKELQQKRKELDSATESIQSAKADYDYISHQYRQLESANLKEGEEKQLEEDMKRLEHASDIETSLAESNEYLSGDNGIISMLKAVVNRLSHISSFDQSFKEIEQRVESCRIEIKDIAEEISSALDASDTDPEKLQKVQDRFDLLYDLMQKHKVNDTSGLLQLQAEYKKRLEQIETGDEKIGHKALQRFHGFHPPFSAAGRRPFMLSLYIAPSLCKPRAAKGKRRLFPSGAGGVLCTPTLLFYHNICAISRQQWYKFRTISLCSLPIYKPFWVCYSIDTPRREHQGLETGG